MIPRRAPRRKDQPAKRERATGEQSPVQSREKGNNVRRGRRASAAPVGRRGSRLCGLRKEKHSQGAKKPESHNWRK